MREVQSELLNPISDGVETYQEEADSETVVADAMRRVSLAETAQKVNEAVVNLPEEFRVGEKTVRIRSKSIKEIVAIDRLIIELEKLNITSVLPLFSGDIPKEEMPNAYDKFMDAHEASWHKVAEIVVQIANGKDTPESDRLVLEDALNMEIGDGSVADQIIQCYQRRNDPSAFVKNVMRARSF